MGSDTDKSGQGPLPPGRSRPGFPGADGRPTAGELCSKNYLTVSRRQRVVEVARLMAERWISSALVIEARHPVGILTKRSIIKDVLARGYTGMEITAGEIMHYPIVSIGADVDVDEAAAIMARTGLRHLAVEEDDRLVGVLSHYHIARVLPDLLRRREEQTKAGV
ncbi:MAG: hypothetical protein Kow00129_04170 [Thermoleophilia bacterium]